MAKNLQCKSAQVDEITSANLTLSGNFTSMGPAYFSDDLVVAGAIVARSNVSISGLLSLSGSFAFFNIYLFIYIYFIFIFIFLV
jgi:hypothetical protein